ncbi:MAG: GTP-binding protein [Myxococcales bacterium]|nr:GTP-binding protein [Myxococcales bacterium]
MQTRHEKPGATPFLLVTGFLGSGKTTLINRWLRGAAGPRLGVVVNEFGQVGIDGALLQQRGDGRAILELANGCVCCVRGTEMWDAALELVDRAGAEVILIETSGLVEPEALLQQYDLLPAAMARRVDLRGLLCVVDPLQVADAITRRPEALHQIEHSDCMLLSKLDCATPEQVRAAHQLLDRLQASRERAGISLSASDDEVAGILRWALAAQEHTAAAKPSKLDGGAGQAAAQTCDGGSAPDCRDGSHAHAHRAAPHAGRQLMAVSLHETQPLLPEPLLQLFSDLSASPTEAGATARRRGDVLRAKGIVYVLGADNTPQRAAVHLAGTRVELRPLDASDDHVSKGSTLVFIGEDLDEPWLRVRLSACRSGQAA